MELHAEWGESYLLTVEWNLINFIYIKIDMTFMKIFFDYCPNNGFSQFCQSSKSTYLYMPGYDSYTAHHDYCTACFISLWRQYQPTDWNVILNLRYIYIHVYIYYHYTSMVLVFIHFSPFVWNDLNLSQSNEWDLMPMISHDNSSPLY